MSGKGNKGDVLDICDIFRKMRNSEPISEMEKEDIL